MGSDEPSIDAGPRVRASVASMWAAIGGEPSRREAVAVTGPDVVLPSLFDVTGLATATVAVANLAAAELLAARNQEPVRSVTVDRRAACAAFVCEHLFAPDGWKAPPIWDAIAGDYRTADGWIKLHTNYRSHRTAALGVLDIAEPDRDAVAATVAGWQGDALEHAVVSAGGCAAVLRTADAWAAHPHGAATTHEPPVAIRVAPGTTARRLGPARRPFAGVRVLDLTRVIAGPVATRFLAAHGADVLRIDPPGFEEVPALLPETTAGKRCASLDLQAEPDRARFDDLVAHSDVIVHGLRPGALAALGFDERDLRARNPGAVLATLDAYGWTGPWATRRGFDSLVQMSCGIAAAPTAGAEPAPLPAQALDHGTGYLLAAAVARALAHRHHHGRGATIEASLLGTAGVLMRSAINRQDENVPAPMWDDRDTERRSTAWGPARAVPIPGSIDGVPAILDREPGPLGRLEPTFAVEP